MKIMKDKLEKVSRKATMGDLFPIILRWYEDKEANEIIRNQEPLDPIEQILA